MPVPHLLPAPPALVPDGYSLVLAGCLCWTPVPISKGISQPLTNRSLSCVTLDSCWGALAGASD